VKRLALVALVAGCAAPTSTAVTVQEGEDLPVTVGTVSAPSPVPTLAVRTVPTRASRSRLADPPAATGSLLNSTAYCETGLMADGHHTYRGAVAANRWPLGTTLRVSDSPYGPGLYRVADHYGHGTQLDFAMPGDCDGARTWGRRDVRVEVVQ
jgi:3D (Asp-Asp-Asp) domain-containing protein